MNDDENMTRLLRSVSFDDEPQMASRAIDDADRGRRRLRRRRLTALGGGAGGVVAASTVAALALSGSTLPLTNELGFAGPGGSATEPTPDTGGDESSPDDSPRNQFPVSSQALFDTAREHFDPDGANLEDSSGALHGSSNAEGVGTVGGKLAWTVPGDDGMGLVQVGVTTPGYVSSDEHALLNFASNSWCDLGGACTERTLPGTEEKVWVQEGGADGTLKFSVVYERPDGSVVAVAVNRLYGNNTTIPVPDVDIDLEQAYAFVTDPDLIVDPGEVANYDDPFIDEHGDVPGEGTSAEPDFTQGETAPAPEVRELSDADVEALFEQCVDGADDWAAFEPAIAVSADTDAQAAATWLIAKRGQERLLCTSDSAGQPLSASMFGTASAKDIPYLFAPVDQKSAGFGMYSADVARVTVQASGGPEQDAIMRDGYWFLPMPDLGVQSGLIGVAGGYALRGYDAAGELMYDSTTDGPAPEDCYSNPAGTEAIASYDADNPPAPETCRRTIEWGR